LIKLEIIIQKYTKSSTKKTSTTTNSPTTESCAEETPTTDQSAVSKGLIKHQKINPKQQLLPDQVVPKKGDRLCFENS
jgi:hypothetical protein